MKHMCLFALLVVISGIFFSCSDKIYSDTKKISFVEASKDYSLASAFRNIHIVQLETNDSCIISEIKRILIVKDNVYILTKDSEIFCFNKSNGRFIRQIGNIGEGPGEFFEAKDIFYNEKENFISVIDPLKNVCLTYSADGKYIKTESLNTSLSWMNNAEFTSDGYLMLSEQLTGGYPSNDYAYTIIGSDGKIIKMDEFAPVKVKDYSVAFASHPMTKCEEGMRFFKFLNDTIFTMSDGEVTPYCILDFGKKILSKDVVAKAGSFSDKLLLELSHTNGYFAGLDKIYETKNFLIFIPKFYPLYGYYWYDKKKKQGIHISSSVEVGLEMKWMLQGRSIIKIVGTDSNNVICSFQQEDIDIVKDVLSEDKSLKPYNEELKTFFEKVDSEGNPCLIFYEE